MSNASYIRQLGFEANKEKIVIFIFDVTLTCYLPKQNFCAQKVDLVESFRMPFSPSFKTDATVRKFDRGQNVPPLAGYE